MFSPGYFQRSICLLACAALTSCGTRKSSSRAPTSEAKTQAVTVCVVNYPLKFFAERIGGDQVQVSYPAAKSGDPALWSPTPEQVTEFQNAEITLLNGASYARC